MYDTSSAFSFYINRLPHFNPGPNTIPYPNPNPKLKLICNLSPTLMARKINLGAYVAAICPSVLDAIAQRRIQEGAPPWEKTC